MKNNRKGILFIGITALLIVCYLIADAILFNGIRPKSINENNFQATYFTKEDITHKTTIVLIGGGQWGDYWAHEFATQEMVGLSLPYIGNEGLPKLPEEIDLKYFENALKWLAKQKEVDSDKIVVMGASRNAELALVIASTFPELIKGVVAYAPSAVSWSNTVLPYNSDTLKPSWKYQGNDIPYVPMEKIIPNHSDEIDMLAYWKKGLSKTVSVQKAMIETENINGPVLLFSGTDDNVWPSALMADMIAQRLKENNFTHSFQNIQYPNAGHMISGNPEDDSDYRTGIVTINGKDYEYDFGGTQEGDLKAKQDAKHKLLQFLEDL